MRRWWAFRCHGQIILLLLLLLLLRLGVAMDHKDPEAVCAAQQSCGACLQNPRCVWCSTSWKDPKAPLVRCATFERFLKEKDLWCREEGVVNAMNEMTILEDRNLSSTKGKEPVQIQPQRIKLRLRRGEEYRVKMRYKQAEDYPVDLYYLMDLSASMEPYRDSLSTLGLKLAEAMRKLTGNFRLGFGSFVDKVVLPMTSTQPDKLKLPCTLKSKKPCAHPYGYKNQMRLTEDASLFETYVQEAPISGNLDSPEGGFDAMMQVMVCTNEIGWRQKARRLIVFCTDAGFHIAGDGRLAGIIEPNDCSCHLDKEGFYTHSLLQDYPSISQINNKARENNMNIIFAVPSHKNATYRLLSRSITGSSVATIEHDSQNVVSLVSSEYEKLVDSITMTDNASKIIDVRYFSRCLDETGEWMERRECGGLRVHHIVEFEVAIKAVECPADRRDWQQTIQIKPRGISESLIVELEIVCDCPCERPGNSGYVPSSSECDSHGDLKCGVCTCQEGFHGKQCECAGNEAEATTDDEMNACKPDNQTTEVCSGHGACNCGMCDCYKRPNPLERFYGHYCECDNFSCKRSGGLVCGGHGTCECGVCNCLPGWAGETCNCRNTNSTCIPPGENREVCSGHGVCVCGVCMCQAKENIRYSGQYCEECPTCPGQRCDELKDCVECVVHNSGPLAKNGTCSYCLHQIDIHDVVEEDPVKDEETGARFCRVPGDAGCNFVFKYTLYGGAKRGDIQIFQIEAQRERICPAPVNVLGVALGVAISTVILGFLVLLVWKVLTVIHDKREYAKFEKERALAKWDRGDNPLYKQATSTFKNPTFTRNM